MVRNLETIEEFCKSHVSFHHSELLDQLVRYYDTDDIEYVRYYDTMREFIQSDTKYAFHSDHIRKFIQGDKRPHGTMAFLMFSNYNMVIGHERKYIDEYGEDAYEYPVLAVMLKEEELL